MQRRHAVRRHQRAQAHVGEHRGRDNVVKRAVLALDQYGVGESVAGLRCRKCAFESNGYE